MADPVLDEEMIADLLKCPISPENVGRIQAGAMQALMDLYDRKATRDEFIAMATPCVALYGQTSKLWLLANVRMVFDSGDLDTNRFEQAQTGLSDIIRVQCETVIEIVKRLRMCPTSQDKVH